MSNCVFNRTRCDNTISRKAYSYTKEELAALRSQILSNLERAWELLGGSEEQLLSTMMQISQVVARQFNKQK